MSVGFFQYDQQLDNWMKNTEQTLFYLFTLGPYLAPHDSKWSLQ